MRDTVSIAAEITATSDGNQAPLDRPQASLRVELLGQIVGAQIELQAAMADLARAGASTDTLAQQMQALQRLQLEIDSADPAALVAMRAQIAAAVDTSQNLGQQARAADGKGTGSATIAEVTAEARGQASAVMAGMRDFHGHLQFASAEAAEDYRRREAERRTYIEAEQAKGTPEGQLNASAAALGQMADAKAHGAGDHPEFQQRWDALVDSTEKLRDAMRAEGRSTEEFDQRLRDDLRRIMKAKGLSDAEIDARFAAASDPLDAMGAFVSEKRLSLNQQDVDAITVKVKENEPEATVEAATIAPVSGDLTSAMAKLKASGVIAAADPGGAPAHGVNTQGQASTGLGRSA